jgi:peptidoglycan/xylan/chitin deacetylase (PgdA/CDA1 family)
MTSGNVDQEEKMQVLRHFGISKHLPMTVPMKCLSPAAVTLTAQPESLPVGKEKVLLTWKPEGDFSSCVASGHANWTGEKSVTENEEEVYGITETTTFTITCTDTLGNDVSDSVTVEKQQPILANYCGDGEVNQDWEACDGSSDCTEQCQLKTDPEPEGLVLARVNIEEFKNWNGGDASDTLYLGSTENAIPSGTWFPLQYISEDTVNLVGDDDITGYEDVPGLAVQRSRGESVRVVLYGSHNKKCNGACAASENPNEDYFDPLVTAQAKEYVSGSVEFFGAQVSAQRDDNSGNNRLEGDYTDGSGKGKYNAGDDEIWIENGLSKFWLVVTTADDGYWTDYEESQLTLGDVNTDGKVDVVDALAIASYIEEYGKNFSDFIADFTGITLIEEEFKQVADYSQDGIIGPFDPYSISRFNTGLPQLTLGDVNTDGKVDVVDALAIASYIEEYGKNFSDFIADFTGITLIEEEFKQVADYSQDGIIGPFDPYSISRFNTGLPQLTLGDVNTDGKVDVVDALAIASYIEEYGKNFSDFIADFTGITLIEEEFKQVADYSQDGIIGPFDPYSISRFNTGLPQLTLGDVNTDGKVDVVDALAIASYIEEYGKNFSDFIADFTGITLIEEEFKQVADYSQDGIIGPFDPYSISRFNTGLPQLTLGDVNTDGKVDVVDALAIASYIEEYGKNFSDFIADFTGITLIEEEFKQVADYSQDGIIGPFDPYSISRFNTGLPQLTLGDVNTDGKVDVVDALAIASYIEEYGKNFSDFIADFTGITLIEEEFKQVADYSQDGIIGPFDPYSISRFNTGLPQLTLGDVNTDGKVDVVDALAIASYIEEYGKNFSDFIADFTGITLIEEEFKQVADYSQDGIIGPFDPYSISRFNTGLPQLTLGDVNTDGKVDVVDALAIASYIEEYGKNFSDFIADFTGITLIEEEFKQVADYSQDGIIGPFDPYSISRFNTGLPQLTLGDVNTDGKVDVVDALAIASYIEEYGKNFSDFIADFTGITLIEEEFKQVADYSQDGIIGPFDPYSISRFNTGLPQLTLGDVNTDGKVDVVDALAIASYIEEYGKNFSDFIADFTGITLIEEEFKQVADYSQDGIVSIIDSNLIVGLDPNIVSYCGDGEVNQDWEACDGSSDCTEQCQLKTDPEPEGLVLARVNIEEFKNWNGGDASDTLYLGSTENAIPSGTWFPLQYISEDTVNLVGDDDITGYEDVPGLAVQRSRGESVRVVLYGSHNKKCNGACAASENPNEDYFDPLVTAQAKEYVSGSVEFFGAQVSAQRDDNSGNNRLEGDYTDGSGKGKYNAGDDEIWIENGLSKFWLVVTTADDGYWTDYEESHPSPEETVIEINGFYDGDSSTLTACGGSAIEPKITFSWDHIEGERAAKYCKRTLGVGTLATCDITVPDTGSDPTELELYFSDADKGNTYDIEISPLDASNTEIGSTKKCRVTYEGKPSQNLDDPIITLNFDDGWKNQYENAKPILDAAGLKASYAIVTDTIDNAAQFGENYMTSDQIKDLVNSGNGIASHSTDALSLADLTAAEQRVRIKGSLTALVDLLGAAKVEKIFVFPNGSYDDTTIQIVEDEGYIGSRTAYPVGYNTSATDPYQLKVQQVNRDTTLDQVKTWIDTAVADKKWLILIFHQVADNPPNEYDTTPVMIREIAGYITSQGLTGNVKTLGEGFLEVYSGS